MTTYQLGNAVLKWDEECSYYDGSHGVIAKIVEGKFSQQDADRIAEKMYGLTPVVHEDKVNLYSNFISSKTKARQVLKDFVERGNIMYADRARGAQRGQKAASRDKEYVNHPIRR